MLSVALGLAFSACGGGGGDAGSGSGARTSACVTACTALEREICISGTRETCSDDCADVIAQAVAAGCTAEYDAYVACAASAGSSLCPGMSLASGSCGAQVSALAACTGM